MEERILTTRQCAERLKIGKEQFSYLVGKLAGLRPLPRKYKWQNRNIYSEADFEQWAKIHSRDILMAQRKYAVQNGMNEDGEFPKPTDERIADALEQIVEMLQVIVDKLEPEESQENEIKEGK